MVEEMEDGKGEGCKGVFGCIKQWWERNKIALKFENFRRLGKSGS